MNPELKEKMQQAADEFAKADTENWQEYERYLVGSIQVKAFRAGATAMYTELAPLVEWVSVDYDLPFEDKSDIIYLVKWWNEKDSKHFFAISSFDHIQEKFTFEVMSGRKITHWRRIEL